VHDGWPPPQVQPLIERPDLARQRHAQGESVPLFRSYADPSVLTDEVIRMYLQPLLSTPQRIEAFERYWLGFDNTHTVAIHDALKTVQVPILTVWSLQDFFSDRNGPTGCAIPFPPHETSSQSTTPGCFSRKTGQTS
jgi:hypothetical protein